MTDKKNTLIILTPGFPETEVDTTCLPMQQSFVRALQAVNPKLKIIVLSFQYPYFKKAYNWFGIQVIPFNGKNKGGFAKLVLRQKITKTLLDIKRLNNITGIFSFWYGECAWIGKTFGDKYGIKHFCWILGQDAKKENTYPRRIRAGGNELIALSDYLQDAFEKNHGTRPRFVIPAGIDPEQFCKTEPAKDIDIVGAGSLIALKSYETFIEVIAALKKHIPGIKAILIGDGPEKNKLQALITSNGLESNITLAGELPHAKVLHWMQRGKVFLHPSSYEGFGIVAIEALHAGCQVISFCKPMNQEIEHWHIARDKAAMEQKTMELLQDTGTIYNSVTPFFMSITAKKMMSLFNN